MIAERVQFGDDEVVASRAGERAVTEIDITLMTANQADVLQTVQRDIVSMLGLSIAKATA
jgi:hypothetical protein